MSLPTNNALTKLPAESRLFFFDFALYAELIASQTLSSPAVTVDDDSLTLGSPTVVGSKVRINISEGTAGQKYTLQCVASTSGGSTIAGRGILQVL